MKLIHTLVIFIYLIIPIHVFSRTKTHSDSLKTQQAKKSLYRASTSRVNDIIHTRLDVRFDWNKSQMIGKATITVKPYFKPTSKLDLNARGMDVETVEVYEMIASTDSKTKLNPINSEIINSKKIQSSYKYENDSIKINLGREFTANEKYLVKINYVAKPNELKKGGSDAISDDKGLFFINPKGEDKTKMPQIWTQGETQANSAWFPTIDSPNEKMTNEIFMTVDLKYTTLSNGILTDTKKNSDGTKTDHWKMDQMHSPYLVMMAVGEFKKVTDAPVNGKEISYYVEPEYETHAKAIFGNTKEMIEFYGKILGTPYPWAKYSQIVVRDYVSGAMENTSATLHGDFMVYQTSREMLDGKKGEDVISHELFHQWFGDLVTAESWSNLPLNESFATYGEYLWQEYKNGRDAADAHSYHSRVGYFNQASEKQVEMIRFNYNSQEEMFDGFSYNKGGQILHMLRKYTGDEAFFASLKLYLEKNKYKNAEIHNLRLAFEEVTGEDLNWFFNQWFLEKGHPELEISRKYDEDSKTVKLTVKQKQNPSEAPLYKLPIDVDLYFGGKTERRRIVIDELEQQFSFSCPVNPDLINFDAERQLLALRSYSRSTEEFIFQYMHAPLYSDRSEALNFIKDRVSEPAVFSLITAAAEKDAWYELRIKSINFLKPLAASKENELKPLLIKIAKTDKNTNVRAFAINFLVTNYKAQELNELYKSAVEEQSYAVLSAALEGLVDTDPSLALQKAKQLESEKNEDVFFAIATVYTKKGNDENNAYFIKSAVNFSGYGLLNYFEKYGDYLKLQTKSQTFETAANLFKETASKSNDYVKSYIKKTYRESIIIPLKLKLDALQKENASTEKIKEYEASKAKMEEVFKSIS